MRPLTRHLAVTLLTVLLTAGCAAPPSSPGAPTAAPTAAGQPTSPTLAHVKFAQTAGATGNAPLYIALERGYFREVGIDVELVNFPGGAQMIPSIAASQVDIANTDAGAGLLNAISRDLPMKFVADGAHCTPGHCTAAFVVRKDLADSGGFKSLQDLRGKTVNQFTPGSTLYQYLYRMLDKAGLKDTDLNLQLLTFDQVLPAFSTKALDASWQIEPFTTQGALQGLSAKFGDAADILGPQQSTVIVYSPTFATQQPDVGKRFMVAYLRGARDFTDAFDAGKDRDAIVDILTRTTNFKDPALYSQIELPAFDPDGRIILDSLKANQEWYVNHGDVKTPVDLERIYDPSYANYAVDILGKRDA